jgi:serine/threonine-protein kinase
MSEGTYQELGPLEPGGQSRATLALEVAAGRQARPVVLVPVPAEVEADEDALGRLERETARACALEHPHIVRVHGLARVASGRVRVTEYADGEGLRRVLERAGRLPPALAAQLVADLALGVHFAHLAGNDDGSPLVHGDLRPETVLLSWAGVAKVAGYGALAVAPREAGGRRVVNRRAYGSPEQLLGGRAAVQPATDVFLLGLVLFECLSGLRPFGDAQDPDAALLEQPVGRLPADVPAALAEVVARCTAKRAKERYASALQVRDALEEALGGTLPGAGALAAWLAPLFPADEPVRQERSRRVAEALAARAAPAAGAAGAAAPPAAHASAAPAPGAALPETAPAAPAPPRARPSGAAEQASPAVAELTAAAFAVQPRSGPRAGLLVAAAGLCLVAGVGVVALQEPSLLPWRAEAVAVAAEATPTEATPTEATAAEAAPPAPVAAAEVRSEPLAPPEPGGTPPAAPGTDAPLAAAAAPEASPGADAPADGTAATSASPTAAPAESASGTAASGTAAVPEGGPVKRAVARGLLVVEGAPELEVSTGGALLGRTPLRVELPAGWHVLSLRNREAGIATARRVQVRAGEATSYRMEPGRGAVTVLAPQGAEVFVDGKSVGVAPLDTLHLYEGTHRVLVTVGGARWQESFALQPGQQVRLDADFTASAAGE